MPRGRGGRGGGYGPKKNYKGQRRHFTDADELQQQIERDKKQKDWRRQQGIESDEEEEEEAPTAKAQSQGAPGDLPPSDSDSEEDSDEDDENKKAKGVEHLIEIENPNRAGGRQLKKVTELNTTGKTQLSRREREEIEKQQAKARYQQLHMEGKTDEARADLARLAIIRKQREDAAKKREEERKAAEEAKGKNS
ncbi:uncharacterized protein LOC111119974 [Crassostrea virginica]|uniref:28 kDa heat- and acid-stable phosphoprotein-like n=1 Tax=Crassostrea virginica TaxID=6565 RepID=A0A8B8CIV5_CRAVI|nr:28 kDa heat- and acid-stable phosphoprotein-like [Crassostrea virginica]XP_022316278.1 28 kDa heat- and acid-stable phosphoprotein-like [Crassostrea virginica]